ncbi:MAG: CBS domain-containing protein [Nanoarchaeota archaeon]
MEKDENKLRKINAIMKKRVKQARKDTPVKKIVEVMAKNKISCIVVTENKKPLGVITERDIIRKVLYKGLDVNETTAEKVMSKKPVTLLPENDIVPAGRMMKEKGVRRFPVVDNNGHLKGVVTQTDILEGIINLVKFLDWKLVKMKISVTEYVQKLKESKFL